MSNKTGRPLCTLLLLLATLPGISIAPASDSPALLGEIVYADTGGDGLDEASSTRLFDGDLVRCVSRAAIVRLEGGRVLRFDTNSSAVLDGDRSGRVGVRVLSGRVTMIGVNGRRLTAGAGSVFDVPAPAEEPAAAEALLLDGDGERFGRRAGRR